MQRQVDFNLWINDLCPILGIHSSLGHILQDRTKIGIFKEPTCPANIALYILLNAHVDQTYKTLIRWSYNLGDATLKI